MGEREEKEMMEDEKEEIKEEDREEDGEKGKSQGTMDYSPLRFKMYSKKIFRQLMIIIFLWVPTHSRGLHLYHNL